ncbi:MAG TPA: GNAT family N-acetyltransferase [Thermomicrobiales bacterium]|nr:GNAT family N-acetyltransferase [Thermomicrobiales bacterium]
MTVSLRPIRPDDEPLLYRLYASTREAEMALTGWTPEEIEDFLRMQFHAQHTHYMQYPPTCYFNVIELDGAPIGRIYTAEWDEDLRLIEITLLPEYRNRGIGTRLIRDVMERARALGKPVRLHVENFNPARHLYERLGFTVLEERGFNLFMEWRGDG